MENDLFRLNATSSTGTPSDIGSNTAFSAVNHDEISLWHRHLGHMSVSNLHFLKNSPKTKLNCAVCAEGKHSRTSFPTNGSRANELLGVVHSDVCGPMSTSPLGGNKYYVTFIDDYSRKVTIFLIKNKSQVFDCFVRYKNMVENQLDKRIKILRTDNGGEFCNAKFSQLCEKSGIIHQRSCPHSPQQNGLAERYNRTIVEKARCMLFDANLPRAYWGRLF